MAGAKKDRKKDTSAAAAAPTLSREGAAALRRIRGLDTKHKKDFETKRKLEPKALQELEDQGLAVMKEVIREKKATLAAIAAERSPLVILAQRSQKITTVLADDSYLKDFLPWRGFLDGPLFKNCPVGYSGMVGGMLSADDEDAASPLLLQSLCKQMEESPLECSAETTMMSSWETSLAAMLEFSQEGALLQVPEKSDGMDVSMLVENFVKLDLDQIMETQGSHFATERRILRLLILAELAESAASLRTAGLPEATSLKISTPVLPPDGDGWLARTETPEEAERLVIEAMEASRALDSMGAAAAFHNLSPDEGKEWAAMQVARCIAMLLSGKIDIPEGDAKCDSCKLHPAMPKCKFESGHSLCAFCMDVVASEVAEPFDPFGCGQPSEILKQLETASLFNAYGKRCAALAVMLQVLKKTPGFIPVFCNVGVALRDIGALDAGFVILRKCAVAYPNNAQVLCHYGFLLLSALQLGEGENPLSKYYVGNADPSKGRGLVTWEAFTVFRHAIEGLGEESPEVAAAFGAIVECMQKGMSEMEANKENKEKKAGY